MEEKIACVVQGTWVPVWLDFLFRLFCRTSLLFMVAHVGAIVEAFNDLSCVQRKHFPWLVYFLRSEVLPRGFEGAWLHR